MTVKELRELTIAELNQRIAELHQKQFELAQKAAVGTLETPNELHNVRKDIARAETVKREKELQIKR